MGNFRQRRNPSRQLSIWDRDANSEWLSTGCLWASQIRPPICSLYEKPISHISACARACATFFCAIFARECSTSFCVFPETDQGDAWVSPFLCLCDHVLPNELRKKK